MRGVLAEKVGNLLEFTEEAEATQYFQSKGEWGAKKDWSRRGPRNLRRTMRIPVAPGWQIEFDDRKRSLHQWCASPRK